MSLSEDLRICVEYTEFMLSAWTNFAKKYRQANCIINVEDYRERLLSAMQKFDEVSGEVDKIVFSREEEDWSPPEKRSRPEHVSVNHTQSCQLSNVLADNVAAADSPTDESIIPSANNVVLGNHIDNSRVCKSSDLSFSPVENEELNLTRSTLRVMASQNERNSFKSHEKKVVSRTQSSENAVSSDEVIIEVIDLTEDVSPQLFQIKNVSSMSKHESCHKPINRSGVENTDSYSTVSRTNSLNEDEVIIPLSEQLYISDDEESTDSFPINLSEEESVLAITETNDPLTSTSKMPVEKQSAIVDTKQSKSASLGASINEKIFPSSKISSLFDVSCDNSTKTLSLSTKSQINFKKKKNLTVDRKKLTATWSKNVERKEPIRCNICDKPFSHWRMRKEHVDEVHKGLFETLCPGCGKFLKRSETKLHYVDCPVYKHKNLVDRINGMKSVLESPEVVLIYQYNLKHLRKQRKLLDRYNEINIPMDAPDLQNSERIERLKCKK